MGVATDAGVEMRVTSAHSFTGRMCAASRWEESQRTDSLFQDPQAHKLAGSEGLSQSMGSWIMVPRTRFGDDFLRKFYATGARQLVLLGAGMDSRAYRMGLDNLRVFEVDQQTTFDVKEPLVRPCRRTPLAALPTPHADDLLSLCLVLRSFVTSPCWSSSVPSWRPSSASPVNGAVT